MIEITEQKRGPFSPVIHIHGDSVEELLEFVMPRIRHESRPFYEKRIRSELSDTYTAGIDCHAIGNITNLYLTPHTHEIFCELVPIDELREFEALYPV